MNKKHLKPGENLHLLCMLWAKKIVIEKKDSDFSLVLYGVNQNILYMTARPIRTRKFILTRKFMSIWIKNQECFTQEPPEIAMVFSEMPPDSFGVAHALPIHLSTPQQEKDNSWSFHLSLSGLSLNPGIYENVALFIDWLPTNYCPEPIEKLFPNLLKN